MRKIICFLLGHVYRNSVPRVMECVVYCLRCGREFGHFDSPHARQMWNDHKQDYQGIPLINLSDANNEWNKMALKISRERRKKS